MIKTYEKTVIEPRLEIRVDQDAESPRQWSNLGYFITIEDKYKCPDENNEMENIVRYTSDEATSTDDHIKRMTKEINANTTEKVLAIYPVCRYEHSAVRYYRGIGGGFDSSNCGFYIVTDKSQKELGTPKSSFEKVIDQELETYTSYANGEVYGYILIDENGVEEDSCWGFYDLDDIKDHLPDEWKNEDMSDYVTY